MKIATKRLIELSIILLIAIIFFASVPVSETLSKILDFPVLSLEVKLITYGFLFGTILQYVTNTKKSPEHSQSRVYKALSAMLATAIGIGAFLMTTTIVFMSGTAAAFFLFMGSIGIAVWITSSIFIQTAISDDQKP